MSGPEQSFSVSRAEGAVYKTGLRSFMEYRDLGIADATHGQFRAHVIGSRRTAPAPTTCTPPGCTSTCATSRCSTC